MAAPYPTLLCRDHATACSLIARLKGWGFRCLIEDYLARPLLVTLLVDGNMIYLGNARDAVSWTQDPAYPLMNSEAHLIASLARKGLDTRPPLFVRARAAMARPA